MMIPVILSGGSGTRLWPLSRTEHPKQFISLHNDATLFQKTLLRLAKLEVSSPIVVCNEDHRFIVAENSREIGVSPDQIILEPFGRNTAPAIVIAALCAIEKHGNDCVLLVLPADHSIENEDAFARAAASAHQAALDGWIVTFGIKPTEANTGYGYIETGRPLRDDIAEIASFKEKPNLETAKSYISSDKYLWNSGMFAFKASVLIQEIEKTNPDVLITAKSALAKSKKDLDFLRLDKEEFAKCPNISIDYAVMEHTKKGVSVMLDAGWSDVGAWDAVWKVSEKDAMGNVHHGDVMLFDTKDSYINAGHKLVTVLGLENILVLDTQDALLVADMNQAQNVKKIVDFIKDKDRSEHKHHRTVYRPWGHSDSICTVGERDQVKRITVKPGGKLSVQKHNHRAEHWVVVKGTAHVTKGDETFSVSENQSVYIPVGVVHSLENLGNSPLEIIEVQTGNYFGEDDIIRLHDIYGRV